VGHKGQFAGPGLATITAARFAQTPGRQTPADAAQSPCATPVYPVDGGHFASLFDVTLVGIDHRFGQRRLTLGHRSGQEEEQGVVIINYMVGNSSHF
jgi:hypothetical protein